MDDILTVLDSIISQLQHFSSGISSMSDSEKSSDITIVFKPMHLA